MSETTVLKLQKNEPENTTELGGNRVPLDSSISDEGRIVNLFIEDLSPMNAMQKQNRKAKAQETKRMLTTILKNQSSVPHIKIKRPACGRYFLVGTQGLYIPMFVSTPWAPFTT